MPYLTPQQERLRDDIRGLIKGDVRCDEITLQLYSTDASLLQCRPQGVVWPRDTDDVVACVRYAQEKGFSIHARGAGTGTAGDSLGGGIVLDFGRFMTRILGQKADSVIVQPGITYHQLNTHLRKTRRRRFGPVSGFRAATTVGSILARDGAGANWLQYGFPSDHLEELKVVLADGQILTLCRDTPPQAIETAQNDAIRGMSKSAAFLGDDSIAKGLALARGIVLGKEHVIADEIYRVLNASYYEVDQDLAGAVSVNRAGYRCHDILIGPEGTHVDLAGLMAGSEGTLGLIVEATLKTVPRPRRGAAVVLFFSGLEKAAQAVQEILPFRPILCELIDRRRLNMVREIDERVHHILPVEAEAVLLVELVGDETSSQDADTADLHDRLSALIDCVQEKRQFCFRSVRVETPDVFARFDAFLHHADLVLFRMKRSLQPLPLFPDLAVPLDSLGTFMPEVLNVLRQRNVTASISGHIGQGQLRIHPLVNLTHGDFSGVLRQLAEDVYALVRKYRGTLSSEGATGFLKSPYLPEQFPKLTPIFRNIKEVFDPNDLLHPGKIIPDAVPWTDRLRHGLPRRGLDHPDRQSSTSVFMEQSSIGTDSVLLSPSSLLQNPFQNELEETPTDHAEWNSQLELQLKWEPQHVFESTYLCNGCGDCFQDNRRTRICPLFRCGGEEGTSPRAVPNLLRGILERELNLETLTREQARDVMGACFHCQMCQVECPAEVDVAELTFRGKSAYVAAHGLPLEDLFMTRIDTALQWLGMISCPVNWALGNRVTRWMMEKILQIPQARKMPKLAKVSYLGHVQWSTWLGKQRPAATRNVALFIDTYANHFDTKLAELAVRILEHNGLSVFVPPRQRASGLVPFALGNMDRAEWLARHNSLLLADLIRQGYHVVTLEPASASCMVQDYPYVVDDIDVALVRSHVVDFCEFLMQLHREGNLRLDFVSLPKTIGYHAPCRSISRTTRRVDAATPAEELLRLIPDMEVRRLEQGCCGMAGTFGLKRRNYRRSIRIGMELFRALRDESIDFGATDCNACRMQMEHGARKETLHPIRLLAAAYGLAQDFH